MIPRIFHRVWVGNSPIPDEYNEYWKKWQLLHSKGWQFINWDNDKIKQLSLYSLIQKVTSNAAKSDIARYEIIYNYGGIYLDCDMDCYQSIDSLIEENDEFIVCNQIDDFSCVCSNSFFAAKTQHRILKNAIEELTIINPDLINSNLNIAEITGPYFFRKVINNTKVKILPKQTFYPYFHLKSELYQCVMDDVYGIHQWNGSWLPVESFIHLFEEQYNSGDHKSAIETYLKIKINEHLNISKKKFLKIKIKFVLSKIKIYINSFLFIFIFQFLIILAHLLHINILTHKELSLVMKIKRKIYRYYIHILTWIGSIFGIKTGSMQYNFLLDYLFLKKDLYPSLNILEVGAMDGKAFDKLYPYLRTANNKTALFIEPLPKMQEELQSNYSDFEAQSNKYFFDSSAVFEKEEELILYTIPKDIIEEYDLPKWAAGISTLLPSKTIFGQTSNPNLIFKGKNFIDLAQTVKVCGLPLKKILKKYDLSHFDILQIDTEGYDYSVLKQALNIFRPSIICFEWANLEQREKKQAISKLLRYKYITFLSLNHYDFIACNYGIWIQVATQAFSNHSLMLLPPKI